MKKFRFTLWAIVALLTCCSLAACGDDDKKEKDDPTPNPTPSEKLETQIIGRWVSLGSGKTWGYEFKRDKTGTGFEGGYTWPITYRISGKKVTITDLDEDYDNTYTVTVSYIDDEMMRGLDEDGDSFTLYRDL